MDVFAISPASPKPLWILIIICVLLMVLLIVFVYAAYSSRNSSIVIEADQIKLAGDFWGRKIPFSKLIITDARIMDLTENTDYLPKRRIFGTGLPGYSSGWFRLHSGEKALLYLTRRQDVVYIPTSDGYSLILSVEEPDRFIETLHRYTQ